MIEFEKLEVAVGREFLCYATKDFYSRPPSDTVALVVWREGNAELSEFYFESIYGCLANVSESEKFAQIKK